jgi:ribosomal protein L11 methyltransferase
MFTARYILTTASTSHDAAHQLADQFDEHFAIDALAVSVTETDEAKGLWNVIAYFAQSEDAENAREALGLVDSEISALPDEDWVRRSLEGLAPVTAGRFFLHGAHDRPARRSGGLSLEIDAGTAFGTGHHGTTAGCLIAFDEILKKQKPARVFDLGCGTGVLAIAAAKALGTKVLATDIDAEAVRVTKLNAQLNGQSARIDAHTAAGLHHPIIAGNAPYDLIFANILARPLVALSSGIARILQPGGHVILSGLTVDQLRWIKATYVSRGLVPTRTIIRGNWVALVLTRLGINAKLPKHGSFERLPFSSRGPGWEHDI